jgi:hypothetical protein
VASAQIGSLMPSEHIPHGVNARRGEAGHGQALWMVIRLLAEKFNPRPSFTAAQWACK